MQIIESSFTGIFEIILEPHYDSRGFFMRTFDKLYFQDHRIAHDWVHENHSCSDKPGIIRGLHFQFPPYSETKLIRCIRGVILDVFLDLRKNSPTFGEWKSLELSEDNKKMILIPRGFAHGFCTLSEKSEVIYKVDNVYSPDYEAGILWNDPQLKIPWPTSCPIVSEKDSHNLTFSDFVEKFHGLSC